MAPKYQTALIGTSDGAIRLSHDAPVPEVVGDHVLIKTKAVSVNPVDTKMTGSYVTADAIAGFDLAGTVEDIGPEATKCGIMLGDRVCTVVLGMNPNEPTIGAFAEWTTAAEWTLLKIPNSLSFEEGASLGISFMTTGLAIFKSLGVPGTPLKPSPQRLPVLVFGGSSSTGTAAIQLLKLVLAAQLRPRADVRRHCRLRLQGPRRRARHQSVHQKRSPLRARLHLHDR
jgi:NADPH:quinone reductase-like Zn-dependent oxidoreductase